MKPIEGEPAFPHGPLEVYDEDRHRYNSIDAKPGMTLRQWYIGQALQGFCANPNFSQKKAELISELSIYQADAVMSLLYPQPKEPNQ